METIARTNVQLMNQLIVQGRCESALRRVYDAYHLAVDLYSGYFQADGKPFVIHGISVASMIASLEMPDDLVVAALLHNIYGNGDFGDGKKNTISPARQAKVQKVVGQRVDDLLVRFRQLRLRQSLDQLLIDAETLAKDDCQLLAVDLADHVEKYLDGALAYYGDCSWILDFDLPNLSKMVDLSQKLGYPHLGILLDEMVQKQVAWMERVPDFLKTKDGQKYLALRIPGSCEMKAEQVPAPRA